MHPPIDDPFADALERAADTLRDARRVAVLTGAGVSAESGIPTFRASDGLWENHPIEDVATPMGFERDPALVWKFYNARRAAARAARPNPGHLALVELEARVPYFTLVTQNVDGLHRLAGSKAILEIHGSLYRTRCTGCFRIEDRGLAPLDELPKCPYCDSLLRPDIVWFHEMLPEKVWHDARLAAQECDILLVVGTSAQVHPAASLIPLALGNGATIVEINLTKTVASDYADIGLYGPSGEVLPKLVAAFTSKENG